MWIPLRPALRSLPRWHCLRRTPGQPARRGSGPASPSPPKAAQASPDPFPPAPSTGGPGVRERRDDQGRNAAGGPGRLHCKNQGAPSGTVPFKWGQQDTCRPRQRQLSSPGGRAPAVASLAPPSAPPRGRRPQQARAGASATPPEALPSRPPRQGGSLWLPLRPRGRLTSPLSRRRRRLRLRLRLLGRGGGGRTSPDAGGDGRAETPGAAGPGRGRGGGGQGGSRGAPTAAP